jgi:hypothetical protein
MLSEARKMGRQSAAAEVRSRFDQISVEVLSGNGLLNTGLDELHRGGGETTGVESNGLVGAPCGGKTEDRCSSGSSKVRAEDGAQ